MLQYGLASCILHQIMNNKTLDHLLIAITVLLDLCFVATAIVVAYWIRFESGWTPESVALHKGGTPPLDDYFRLIPLMVIIWLMTLKGLKLYRPESNATLSAFWTLCKAAGISLIATLATLFFIYSSRCLLALGYALSYRFQSCMVVLGSIGPSPFPTINSRPRSWRKSTGNRRKLRCPRRKVHQRPEYQSG